MIKEGGEIGVSKGAAGELVEDVDNLLQAKSDMFRLPIHCSLEAFELS